MRDFRAAAVVRWAISESRGANPLDLLELDALPGRVADDGVEASLGVRVLPTVPHAGTPHNVLAGSIRELGHYPSLMGVPVQGVVALLSGTGQQASADG